MTPFIFIGRVVGQVDEMKKKKKTTKIQFVGLILSFFFTFLLSFVMFLKIFHFHFYHRNNRNNNYFDNHKKTLLQSNLMSYFCCWHCWCEWLPNINVNIIQKLCMLKQMIILHSTIPALELQTPFTNKIHSQSVVIFFLWFLISQKYF